MEATDCVELESGSRVIRDKLIELKAKVKDPWKTTYTLINMTITGPHGVHLPN